MPHSCLNVLGTPICCFKEKRGEALSFNPPPIWGRVSLCLERQGRDQAAEICQSVTRAVKGHKERAQ